ncbi:ankyrin repeat-containing protein [Heterostelium album PN500]|uniref:Ankyrin repeat-containing protein n=1 Tax=Heterostelium pallidum (strain ATCC 26659 / Pp 5 / PN500) TaxID=670386 RepID=D3BG84_HETP5|nr:ankyrin repeat-containing protein [Heterostelium album PN500]EFA79484.1 ankyrin repeat-containing protein [Heterostelium album PN500]|eukprot:XP_020431605.1 ankyrin repeat-containing protein [Heterostelium album PN500]
MWESNKQYHSNTMETIAAMLEAEQLDWQEVINFHHPNFMYFLRNSSISIVMAVLTRYDRHQNTIFHTAAFCPPRDDFINDIRILLRKLDYNISADLQNLLTQRNINDETPLHLAAMHQNIQYIRSLVGLQVDGSLVDNRNLTALDIAVWLDKKECINLLTSLRSSKMTVSNGTGGSVPIYQWGQMLCPSLSLIATGTPTGVLFNQKEHSPTTIKFGQNFAVMLTDTGGVYSWGLCSYGKLGHPTKNDISIPSMISAFKNKQITQIACGKDHSLALDEIGVVYAWGNGSGGRLGLGNSEVVSIPKIIPHFEDEKITSIACGQEFSLALSDSGKVFSWGKGLHGNLGYDVSTMLSQSTPKVIPMLPPASQISCGNWHSMVLSKSGDVYTFGSNIDCRLGHSGNGSTPTMVQIGSKIKKIGAGANFNAVLSESNAIYTWGSNIHCQLGVLLPDHRNYTGEPQVVKTLLPYPISTIEVGYEHVVVLTDTGEVFTFGDNSMMQCGVGEAIKEVCNFTRVKIPDNSTVFKIAAGGNSSLISLSSGHNIYGSELASLLTDESLVDLRFIVNGDTAQYVNCHRAVVACRVPKLLPLISSEIKNPNSDNSHEISITSKITASTINKIIYIDFKQISFESLKLFIKFIYTDHVPLIQHYVDEIGMLSTCLGVERLAFLCNLVLGKTKSLESIPSSNLSEDFKKLSDPTFAESLYDITFKVHEPSGNIAEVQSFKVMLCLRSKYFKMMLSGSFIEGSMNSINIHDVSISSFKDLLHYFYCNEVPSDPNDCFELVILADFHQIARAKELCSAVIRPSIDNTSLLFMFQFSKQYDLKSLTVWCESRISQVPNAELLEGFDRLTEENQKFVKENCAKAPPKVEGFRSSTPDSASQEQRHYRRKPKNQEKPKKSWFFG